MDNGEFVSVYSRFTDKRPEESRELSALLEPARAWSRHFGEVLYDHLEGKEMVDGAKQDIDNPNTSFINQYRYWGNEHLATLADRAIEEADGSKVHVLNELNFHNLNGSMAYMWSPIAYGDWGLSGSKFRQEIINETQESLALRGFVLYCQREQAASGAEDYQYFSQERNAARRTYEGILNEFDVAIALLEVIKRMPNATVVPAPAQFEHGQSKSYNADFVVVTKDRRAVGIQAKSQVRAEDQERYDPKRIVLVDAKIDLANVLARRTSTKSSERKSVAWAGLICAHRLLAIKTQGKNSAQNHLVEPNAVMMRKMLARQLVGNTRPNITNAAKIIGERIAGLI